MEKTKTFFVAIAIALGALPWFLPSIAAAQAAPCTATISAFPGSQFSTIQDAINAAFPGATIFVTGTCNESNIFIGDQRSNIRLNGRPPGAAESAIIFSQTPPGTPVQEIRLAIQVQGATGVRIMNFVITSDGTADGVNIVDGANARLQNNVIENMFREGLLVRAASARIFGNTIQNNGGDGIVATESSAVRIGFSSTDDGNVTPNTIQGNAGHGISVLGSSNARIVGNKPLSPSISGGISANGGHGISVAKGSHADIASNEISGNGGDGINVRENSDVNLGSAVAAGVTIIPPVPAVFTEPNVTTALNGGFGIQCSIGGSANGDLGTLDGTAGARSFDKTCVNAIPKK